ncbi:MAG TPA: putative LPS assembly protein LptD, partial [Gemmatimonadaceae bacterium]|nr:putative LPS assembly protein LptD [Gemmatimonadaceae bacterium]
VVCVSGANEAPESVGDDRGSGVVMRGAGNTCVIAGGVAACFVLVCAPSAIRAQVTSGGRPTKQIDGQPPPRAVLRTAEDSARARRDSLKALPLVKWEPADSIGLQLMQRKGYQVVRYRADVVQFGAKDRVIRLTGNKAQRAAVQREPTLLVADTIIYSDTASMVAARGDSITMRDPSRGEDIHARRTMSYNMKKKEGIALDVSAADKSNGQEWYITAHGTGFADSTGAHPVTAFYGRDGTITSCDDSIPHYHFSAREIKRVSGSIMVARSVVLHIMDVPVFWFPFIFQDGREGRRTGMLTPRFGVTELFRNSPTYRRNVENLGYYFALSDYYDAQFSVDWRSSAKATDLDPGWVRFNGGLRYRWLDRFLSGTLLLSKNSLSTGSTNTLVSWTHDQYFSLRSHLSLNFNYSSNTTVQRQTVFNPLAAVATIGSQVNYQREMGNVSLSLGGTQRQYPGRPQLDRDFPSLNISTKPLTLARWLTWSPSFSAATHQSLHMDSQGDFSSRYITRSDGILDSVKVDRSTRTSEMSFNTPFKLFDSEITLAFRAQDRENDFPEKRIIVDPVDTAKRSTRVYARTYLTTADFDLNFSIPQLIPGPFHVVPSFTLSNVDPNPYFVRSERTGSRWVAQSKRPSYGLGISPTFFGFFRGLGIVEMFRHAITPTLSYSYSPAAAVSNDYLAALGETQTGYLGSFAQNRVTLGITQYIEAKLRQPVDTVSGSPPSAKKIRVLSLTMTPLTWDFERARKTKKSGFATDNFGYTLQSELLPGFDFGADYSLFQGNVLSDSAKFSPFLTNIHSSFSLNATSPIVRFLAGLLGVAQQDVNARDSSSRAGLDQASSRVSAVPNVASQEMRSAIAIPATRGFEAQITFSKTQQRPPVGGNVIQFDPTLQCAPLKTLNPIQYDFCVRNAQTAPPQDISNTATTAGGSFIRYPPQTNIQARSSFNLTEKWSASWATNYDLERRQFGSQTVSLQRDLHDWHAVFGFTQAPNGNFAFTFFVSLKAEPDIKFDYNRSSYRVPQGVSLPP